MCRKSCRFGGSDTNLVERDVRAEQIDELNSQRAFANRSSLRGVSMKIIFPSAYSNQQREKDAESISSLKGLSWAQRTTHRIELWRRCLGKPVGKKYKHEARKRPGTGFTFDLCGLPPRRLRPIKGVFFLVG